MFQINDVIKRIGVRVDAWKNNKNDYHSFSLYWTRPNDESFAEFVVILCFMMSE